MKSQESIMPGFKFKSERSCQRPCRNYWQLWHELKAMCASGLIIKCGMWFWRTKLKTFLDKKNTFWLFFWLTSDRLWLCHVVPWCYCLKFSCVGRWSINGSFDGLARIFCPKKSSPVSNNHCPDAASVRLGGKVVSIPEIESGQY